jgi:hypothetical protein
MTVLQLDAVGIGKVDETHGLTLVDVPFLDPQSIQIAVE